MHKECCKILGKLEHTRAAGECIFQLSKSRATSREHGSRYPARKTIREFFHKITTVKQRLTFLKPLTKYAILKLFPQPFCFLLFCSKSWWKYSTLTETQTYTEPKSRCCKKTAKSGGYISFILYFYVNKKRNKKYGPVLVSNVGKYTFVFYRQRCMLIRTIVFLSAQIKTNMQKQKIVFLLNW